MNLVEIKDKYIKDREELVKKREELIQQLKDIEISIERYNGAIVSTTDIIKKQEEENTVKVQEPTADKPKMKIQK